MRYTYSDNDRARIKRTLDRELTDDELRPASTFDALSTLQRELLESLARKDRVAALAYLDRVGINPDQGVVDRIRHEPVKSLGGMFGAPLAGFLNWVSIDTRGRWLDLHEALGTSGWGSPIAEFHLFSGDRARAIEMLKLDEPLECRETIAKWPLHEGFIAALELVPAGYESARPAVDAFFERERRRDVEPYLRECYRNADGFEHDIAMNAIDYPVFDNGSAGLAFGLMIDRHQRRWLWSRAVYAHK